MDDINLGIIIAQIVNFLVLFFIFKHFLGDRLVKLIHERKNQLEKIGNIDADVKAKIEEAESKGEKIVEEARKKALEIESSSEDLAKKNKEKILAEAEMQAQSIISGARADMEKEKLSLMSGLKEKIVSTALKINEKLFSSEKVNKDFVEKELNSIKL